MKNLNPALKGGIFYDKIFTTGEKFVFAVTKSQTKNSC